MDCGAGAVLHCTGLSRGRSVEFFGRRWQGSRRGPAWAERCTAHEWGFVDVSIVLCCAPSPLRSVRAGHGM